MKKRYYISEGYEEVAFKEFLAVDEDKLVEKVILANTVRVPKRHIENIEEYIIESVDSNETMELEDAKEYIFLTLDELTNDEVYYLNQDGHIYLEELELLGYIPRDCFNQQDEEYEKGREIFKEYLEQSIIEKMKEHGFKASYLDSYIAYIYWDGSNMKEEDLSSEHSRWIDYTDELSDMKEIDEKRYNTGHDTLYKTKDGSKVLVYTSYWQGRGKSIAFLPDDIETVDEAREYIYQQEQEFFGSI